jgi:hypothetical protein
VRSVEQLTLEETRTLVGLFGEIDRSKSLILMFLTHEGSKWDILSKIKQLPKRYRIPTATFYRKFDELRGSSFLEVVGEKPGRAGLTVIKYGLSLKGYLAAAISAYEFFLDSRTPANLEEDIGADRLIQLVESNPAWPLFVTYLRWHRDRGIDLSNVKLDMVYFGPTLAVAILDHPEELTVERLRKLAEGLDRLGISVPEITSKQVADLNSASNFLHGIGGRFFADLAKKEREYEAKKEEMK